MKSKGLFHLGILFFMVVAIMFFCGYEYVKAQTWTALPPYNFLWPSGIPTLSPTNLINSLSTPTLPSLTTVPSIKQSGAAQIWGIPTLGYNDLPHLRGTYGSMDAIDWQQEINIRTSMPFPPSYTTDYGRAMLGPQPSYTADNDDYGYGSQYLYEFKKTPWNPYAYVGRFAPARIRNTLYEFTKQIPEQELYPLPTDWQPFGDEVAVAGGGRWIGFGLYRGGWTSIGGYGSTMGGMGGWLGYGSALGLSGFGR